MKILLASSSPYRRQQLQQLGLPFDCASPDIDETPLVHESIDDYVLRLARQKAEVLASDWPEHWIIGSDQSCSLNGTIVGKAGNLERAQQQLRDCSGQRIRFATAVALWHQGQCRTALEPIEVQFRQLTDADILHYLQLEQPFDCAGSFKIEGLGIHLFEGIYGRDFNSLIGLPLIALLELFRQAGANPLAEVKR
ncbi:Maf family protein [Oceanobacter mangrovi]|uniref:Maf family protein n=1 Tax=Oceanobacter mangrovi TaxID=2862510 RepID=UPI001C8E894F|nr:nucleoside triphosphate pyrophosphatase [Oceanobacter mangrovi]